MVRRPSFTFYEDYQNSTHELARLTLTNESNSQFKNGCEPSELNVPLKSNSQPVFDLFIPVASSTEPDSVNTALGAMQLSKVYNSLLGSTYCPKLKCTEYLSPSSLLSSTLISLSSSAGIGDNNLNSETGMVYLHSDTCQNCIGLLGCLQIAAHSLASMVMPMRHSVEINSTNGKFQPSNLNKFSSLHENLKIYPLKSYLSDKDTYTDVNYASCTDTSSKLDDISSGYYSDNYLIEAVKASTKCGINDRWLNMKFHHSSDRFPLLKGGTTTDIISIIPLNSSQSLYNHELYPKSNTITSNNDRSDMVSVSEDILRYSTLERFCNLWTDRHSQTTEDKFYYMDEKSLERRVRAQASNIISPVSF
ncbi:leishmanolysin-2 (M08 family) [Schistosoma japonicum]|nr:leishmanolysin-2 (M08 family) [Schistosoma japonicum]